MFILMYKFTSKLLRHFYQILNNTSINMLAVGKVPKMLRFWKYLRKYYSISKNVPKILEQFQAMVIENTTLVSKMNNRPI